MRWFLDFSISIIANMTSIKNSVLITVLLPIRHAIASPIPQIFSPQIGQLSFAELIQQSLCRVFNRGFIGILYALLIFACLLCTLICVFCALRANVEHRRLSLQLDESLQYSDKEDTAEQTSRAYEFRPRTETRLSRYILGSPTAKTSSPVTKITIHASSVRKSKTTPPSSPPSFSSRSTPLRSALSKSPPPSQFSTTQTFLFGTRRRSSPSSSPKSVRWADDIQVSVFTTLELSTNDHDEFDLGTPSAIPSQPYSMKSPIDRSERDMLISSRSRDLETVSPLSTMGLHLEGDTC